MKNNVVFLMLLLVSGCTSQVGLDYHYNTSSPESLILLSLNTTKTNTSIGNILSVYFVEIEGAEPNFTVISGNNPKLSESVKFTLDFTASIYLDNYFSTKRYYLLKTPPGKYAIERLVNQLAFGGSLSQYTSCFLRHSIYFDVRPGEVSYIGDYTIEPTSSLPSTIHLTGTQNLSKTLSDFEAAKVFMKSNYNNKAPLVQVTTKSAKISESCKG